MHVLLHRPAAGEPSQQRPGRHLLGPVRAADQHHRRHRRRVGVVVLAGVLEDLLHRAARAGQEHDAGVALLQQDRLAGGVVEVLGDRGRERRSAARARSATSGCPASRRRRPARRDRVERRPRPRPDRRPERRAPRRARDRRRRRRPSSPVARARRRGWPPPWRPGLRRWPRCAALGEQRARAVRPRCTPAGPAPMAWPPITPTRLRPRVQSARASSIAWSCRARASARPGRPGCRDQA